MRRAQAERAVSASTLTMSERTVMMMLLRRANNADCSIPKWNTPTIAGLAREIPLSERRLRRVLAHLVKHKQRLRVVCLGDAIELSEDARRERMSP